MRVKDLIARFPIALSAVFASTAAVFLTGRAPAAIIADGGFESPVLTDPSFSYEPAGTPWTFLSATGIISGSQTTNGINGFSNTPAPEGVQVAFIQAPAPGGGASSVAQQLSGLSSGSTYQISFDEEGRNFGGGANPFEVLLDSTVIVPSRVPASTAAFDLFAGDFVVPSGGTHTLTFEGLSPPQDSTQGGDSTDKTTFIDNVQVTAVPEPSAVFATALGALPMIKGFRRRRKF